MFIPALVAFGLLFLDINAVLGNLIAAMSIFAGFLVNAIILMFSLMDKITGQTNNSYVNFVTELTQYMIFSLYLSIISVTFLIVSPLDVLSIDYKGYTFDLAFAFRFIAGYFTVQFFLTLLKVVSKLYDIFVYNISTRN
ncbi:hypothetical protein GCM10008957_50300 [Deinococcus ruber]|uniref:Uncharacterized protein n=1 Tax=Deinococcus ruber TaxID=1848197 RepID=A0A918FEI1_9DEIO|nr:hypothetical protein GCM10008957_50300 [Deinococcus ruber]